MNSKKQIIDAFTYLLRTTPYDQIKINDICKQAKVSRQTFYAHYSNKDEVFQLFHSEMLFSKCIDKMTSIDYFYSDEFILNIFNFYDEWSDLYKGLRKWDLLPYLSSHALVFIMNQIEQITQNPMIINHLSYFLSYVYEPITAIAMKWIENGKKESVEELLEMIKSFKKYSV